MVEANNSSNNFWGKPCLVRRSDNDLAPIIAVEWQAPGAKSLSVRQGEVVFVDPADHLSPTVRFESPEEAQEYVSKWVRHVPHGFDQAAGILQVDAVHREFLAPDRVNVIVDLAVRDLLQVRPPSVSTSPRI